MTIADHIHSPPGNAQPAPEQPAPTLKELEEIALAAHAKAMSAMEEAPHSSLLVTPEEWEAARARFRSDSAAYIAAVDIWTDAIIAANAARANAGA